MAGMFELTEGYLIKLADGLPVSVRAELLSNTTDYCITNSEQLWSEFQSTDSPYHKASLIRLLGHTDAGLESLIETMLTSAQKPVSTACCETLLEINADGHWPESISFDETLSSGIRSGDVTVIGLIAMHIREHNIHFEGLREELASAKDKLELPMEIETLYELENTIAHLDQTEWTRPLPEYNHPVDWDHVKTISPDAWVEVTTSKGSFSINLKVEEAPGSVSNFLKLVEDGYYTDKFFHRVVPNFVIQTGCPRGDGWGSVPYSIRSEFDIHDYREGAVGLASAGKDTESCQWFVTHSPTPHLEGRYTIFGYVSQGMDVVRLMEVGDQIISMDIK
jgi:cyclophilin family peptidyl-prolyl cis-trans isomerase